MNSYKIKVQNISMSVMEEAGFDLNDGGQAERGFYGKFAQADLLSHLTNRQRQIVYCLIEGRSRLEIANHLLITEQAVHQIIHRIRKRLVKLGIKYGKFAETKRSKRPGGNKKSCLPLPHTTSSHDGSKDIYSLA